MDYRLKAFFILIDFLILFRFNPNKIKKLCVSEKGVLVLRHYL